MQPDECVEVEGISPEAIVLAPPSESHTPGGPGGPALDPLDPTMLTVSAFCWKLTYTDVSTGKVRTKEGERT